MDTIKIFLHNNSGTSTVRYLIGWSVMTVIILVGGSAAGLGLAGQYVEKITNLIK